MPEDSAPVKFFPRFDPENIVAHQWFRNGDHPLDYANDREGFKEGEAAVFTAEECRNAEWEGEVVRYYRNPGADPANLCGTCGNVIHQHGFLDEGSSGQPVCPGDWIVDTENGKHVAVPDVQFRRLFRKAGEVDEEDLPDEGIAEI